MEILLLVCAVLLLMIWFRVGHACRVANVATHLVGTTNEYLEKLDKRLEDIQQRMKDNNIKTDREREHEYNNQP